jgi:limonene-1,2-epoxide hydrolase
MHPGFEVVDEMYAAWRRPIDPARIGGLFAPDGVWQNMMDEPVIGPVEIAAAVDAMAALVEDVEFTTVTSAASGKLMLAERLDWITWSDGARVGLPVTGVFEVDHEGRLAAWRDYYDARWLEQATATARSASRG